MVIYTMTVRIFCEPFVISGLAATKLLLTPHTHVTCSIHSIHSPPLWASPPLCQPCGTLQSLPLPFSPSSKEKQNRNMLPRSYYVNNEHGATVCVYSVGKDVTPTKDQIEQLIPGVVNTTNDLWCPPLFTKEELATTYHDKSSGQLGCAHYARSCKLRHPLTGVLHTCRLCASHEEDLAEIERMEEVRKRGRSGSESSSGGSPNMIVPKIPPFDRYSVKEVLCMKCQSLQPASDKCCNCYESFARYNCRICNLYDDKDGQEIYHCPFCNVCRKGKGLGHDFRHCMQCNACVSIVPHEKSCEHVCISQTLGGCCSICQEGLFNATMPLKKLNCGHVMHLHCYSDYRKKSYKCPICKKSMEDMSDYFKMIEKSIQKTPMPRQLQNLFCKVQCHDCNEITTTEFHQIGLKCTACEGYNTVRCDL